MVETIDTIVGTIMAVIVSVPFVALLFYLWHSGALRKMIEDDNPQKRIDALNRIADAIEHLAMK